MQLLLNQVSLSPGKCYNALWNHLAKSCDRFDCILVIKDLSYFHSNESGSCFKINSFVPCLQIHVHFRGIRSQVDTRDVSLLRGEERRKQSDRRSLNIQKCML